MKALAVVFSLVLTTSVFGQAVRRSFGSVVFPGGTSSTTPTITRNFGSVVFPGGTPTTPVYGGAPVVSTRPSYGTFVNPNVAPVATPPARGSQNYNGRKNTNPYGRGSRGSGSGSFVYAYPVFIGGGYDNSYATQEPGPQQPNVTVVVPPQQANPVMIQAGPDGEYTTMVPRQTVPMYEPPRRREAPPVEEPDTPAEPTRYLLAFKDHTIYSAVAYWADGDTLHYFTKGDTHNQVSMSLIDRPLTERLNRELGIDFKLPTAK